jgi:putative redox protein
MVEMTGVYQGEKHCEITHGPSKSTIVTDAPKDNAGRGEAFSPTDLVGAALATCILTTVAIVAERDGHEMKGSTFKVVKEMNANPRQIARLRVELHLLARFDSDYRKKLEQVAGACPVARALKNNVEISVGIHWDV